MPTGLSRPGWDVVNTLQLQVCRYMTKEEASTFLNKMSILYKIDNMKEMSAEAQKIEYVAWDV